MNVIQQNILTVKAPALICHQVNCQGVMNAGLAKQIKEKFPYSYHIFKRKTNWKLGDCQIVKMAIKDFYIAHLAGQYYYGGQHANTNYNGLTRALRTASDFAHANDLKLYIPHQIGCGLAGGSWDTVKELILENTINPIICKLEI